MIRIMIWTILILFVSGCSQVFEPTIQNHFLKPLTIIVHYRDKTIKKFVLLDKCTHIGRSKDDIRNIEKINFAIGGKLLYVLNTKDIERLMRLKQSPKYKNKRIAWVVSREGVDIKECTPFMK